MLTALLTLSFFFGFRIGGVGISFGWFIVLGTGIWAAVDSTKIQLKRYKSGISYGPVVIFICFVGLWIVAFPWYLILRYKIKTGTAILKESSSEQTAAALKKEIVEDVKDGTPCVSCEKRIAVGSNICPFCGWTQP